MSTVTCCEVVVVALLAKPVFLPWLTGSESRQRRRGRTRRPGGGLRSESPSQLRGHELTPRALRRVARVQHPRDREVPDRLGELPLSVREAGTAVVEAARVEHAPPDPRRQ